MVLHRAAPWPPRGTGRFSGAWASERALADERREGKRVRARGGRRARERGKEGEGERERERERQRQTEMRNSQK